MFENEGWMKKHLDDKLANGIAKLSNKDLDIKALRNKAWYQVLRGTIFVGGSIFGSSAVGKVSEKIAPTVANPFASDKKKEIVC